MQKRADTTSQTILRAVIVLLVGLLALSSGFGLDIVLGAFAAGFILRTVFPEGHETLETKLNGIGYGFFIPLFFIVSGAKVNLAALGENPTLLVVFIFLLLLVRAMPVLIALTIDKTTRHISLLNRLAIAFYCTTALPLIVAITSVTVSSGAMSNDVASVLVGAGALTVFLMPLLASIATRVVSAHPLEAVKEIAGNPHDFRYIVDNHLTLERVLTNPKLSDEERQQVIESAVNRASKLYAQTKAPQTEEEAAERRKAVKAFEDKRREWLLDRFTEELKRRQEESGDGTDWYEQAKKHASAAAERAQMHADMVAEVAERVNELAEESRSDEEKAGKDRTDASSK